jgi:predicted methyltransferase
MNKLALSAALALALAACSQPPAPPAEPVAATPPAQPAPPAPTAEEVFSAKMVAVLAGAQRSDANKARDQYRHPRETLAFFGFGPGQRVVEITPGAGWFTEVLAPALKGDGKLVVAVVDPASAGSDSAKAYYEKSNKAYGDKLAADAASYGEVEVVSFDQKAPSFGPAGSANAVYTFRNVHNFTNSGSDGAVFKAAFDVLKAGGTFGVEEHRANPGTDSATSAKSGYVTEDYVIQLASDAGFELVARSEINANPKDTKDYEGGVWTLPPSLRGGEKDRDKFLAIGESDRMTLKFRKPDPAAPATGAAGDTNDSFEAGKADAAKPAG